MIIVGQDKKSAEADMSRTGQTFGVHTYPWVGRAMCVGVLVVLGTLVLSSCSGSTSGHPVVATSGHSTTAAVSAPAPTSSAEPTIPAAAISATLLRASDVPTTWATEKGIPPKNPDAFVDALARCLNLTPPTGGAETQYSPEFYNPKSLASAYSSSRPRTSALHGLYQSLLKAPQGLAASCESTAVKSAVLASPPPGSTVGLVTSLVTAPPTGVAPDAVLIARSTVEYRNGTTITTVFENEIIVEGASVIASVRLSAPNLMPNASIQAAAVNAVAGRVK